MKRCFLFVLLVLLSSSGLFGQDLRTTPFPHRRQGISFEQRPDKASAVPLEYVKISDDKWCVYNQDLSFVYFGTVRERESGVIPHGFGICRNQADEYALCPWKRGFRHGTGLLKRSDGTVVKARWRWDRLKEVFKEPPAQEELDEFEFQIKQMDIAIRRL